MAILRVFLVFFFIFASYQQVDAYQIDAFQDYIEFCKDLLIKHDITLETLIQNREDQSENYKAFILEALDALPDYGLAGPSGNEEYLEYIKWCIDNLPTLHEKYGDDVKAFVEKFLIKSIPKLPFGLDVSMFQATGDGKGIVDFLQWCKDAIRNYGPEIAQTGSRAFKNFVKSSLRHMKDFGLSPKHKETWGEEGYPGKSKMEHLIKKCLDLLVSSGYKGSWSRYIKDCLQFLGELDLSAYEFIFEGEGGALIAKWQQKLADIMAEISKQKLKHSKPPVHDHIKKVTTHVKQHAEKVANHVKQHANKFAQHFGGFRFFNAEQAQAAAEQSIQAQQTVASGESNDNQPLIIGLLVIAACSLVANVVIVAMFFKRRQSLDRIV